VPGPRMLFLMALPLVAAALVLAARRGTLRGLLALRLRRVWLIWLAAGVQLLRSSDPAWAAPFLAPLAGLWPVLATWACAAVFVAVNLGSLRRSARAGLAVFAVGCTLNSLTVALNGGMPFSVPAARRAGLSDLAVGAPSVGHRWLGPDTLLKPFADVIAVPGLHMVLSIGDVLMLIGAAWLLAAVVLAAHGTEGGGNYGEVRPDPDVAKGLPGRGLRGDGRRGDLRARRAVPLAELTVLATRTTSTQRNGGDSR